MSWQEQKINLLGQIQAVFKTSSDHVRCRQKTFPGLRTIRREIHGAEVALFQIEVSNGHEGCECPIPKEQGRAHYDQSSQLKRTKKQACEQVAKGNAL